MRVAAQLLLTFLLNASWQIALVAVFALVCDWLLRGTAARYRHGVWVAALFLALALPLLSSARVIKPFIGSRSASHQADIAADPIFVTSVSSPDLDSMEPLAAENSASRPAPARRNFLASAIHLNRNLAIVLIALYGLFLLFRASQLIRAWRRTKTIVQSAIAFESTGPIEAIIKKCQAAIGGVRVRILCSTSVPVPITVGILNPVIILPERLLQDVDEEVLTTAIGHELVHVSRRDYLANLVYELIYLPLSFHPAVALVRRRIKQTRELCCDEAVATKLLRPETYARSLVRLIGSAPLGRRMAADTTIGISESDILEVRIMTLLNTRKLTARRKRLLLITASLLLVAPCIAATSFALTFDIDRQEPSVTPQPSEKLERQKRDRVREELKRTEQELKEQARVAPASQRVEIEAQLHEVQKSLRLHEETLSQFYQQKEERLKRLQELRETLAQAQAESSKVGEARMKQLRQQVAMMEVQIEESEWRANRGKPIELQQSSLYRKARVIYRVEPEYTADARDKKIEGTVVLTLTIDHQGLPQNIQVKRSLYPSLDQSAIEAARKMRFEPAMKNGQPVSMVISVEMNFQVELGQLDPQRAIEDRVKREIYEREKAGIDGPLEMKRRRDLEQSQEERARKQAELTKAAVLSMDRAIQIATSQVPGKVLACSLGRDGDKVFYHVVIIGGDGDKSTATYVWVSAIDGQILKTEKETTREREESATEPRQTAPISSNVIHGGVLNGKATSLPQPVYPAIARQARASGAVNVEVLISEGGEVVAAHAVSGHPLLQASAVTAARQASFTPTRLNGEPVRVSGILVYNFVAQ